MIIYSGVVMKVLFSTWVVWVKDLVSQSQSKSTGPGVVDLTFNASTRETEAWGFL